MADGGLGDRAEKGHKKEPPKGYVLAKKWLKHWTFQWFCGIINTVKTTEKAVLKLSEKPKKSSKSIAELEHQISMLIAENDSQKEEINNLRQKLEHMNEILLNMQRARFGQSSEKQKYVSPDQLSVFNEAEAEQDPKAPEPDEKTIIVPEHKRKPKRPLADRMSELPSENVILELPEDERNCSHCGKSLRKIGKRFLRKELIVIRKQIKVINYYTYTYTCDNCVRNKGVTRIYTVQPPEQLIKHSYVSPSLIADVMTQKYVSGVPLARQEKIWLRDGLANWMIKVAEKWLKPLYKLMKKQLLAGSVVYSDETVVQVLKEDGKTPQSDSRMWVYGSDIRSGRAIRIFEYQPDRTGERPKRFLSSFKGYLVTDGYTAYNAVENVTRCGCWAHMRRAWRDAMPKGATTQNSKAAVGYNYCNKLFALERKWKTQTNAERLKSRQYKAETLVNEYYLWVRSLDPVIGSKLEDAVNYALNQEQYLRAFLKNGEVEISNNFAENAIRPFVIGRKNWLFSDTVKGAKSSAIIYSLIETAKANGVEPYAYLTLILTDMQYMGRPFSNEELENFMPWSEKLKESIASRTRPVPLTED